MEASTKTGQTQGIMGGTERLDFILLKAELESITWQDIIVRKEQYCWEVRTNDEVLARIQFKECEGFIVAAHIRTDFLNKFRDVFVKIFHELEVTFDRLRPYASQ